MNSISFWFLGALALVLLVVVLRLLWRRNPLQPQLDASRQALAVAQSRLATLEADREASARDLAALRDRHQSLVGECSRLTATLAHSAQALGAERSAAQERVQQQQAWIAEQTQRFEERVLAAAARLMEERGKAFTELNAREVDAVVAPFKAQLAEFRQRVDHIYDTENHARGELRQQILQLTSLNQAVSLETQRLTNALTVTSKSTGDWGETILASILEQSGLREGREYRLQHPVLGAQGERLQPDAVIFLPGNRQLVVDSKVSNRAWTQYCAATDEGERAARLKDHLLSVRTHVRGLAGKDYARSPDLSTVDFVLMFMPVEGALLAALAADESLYAEAFHRKIILVTPSTLMAVVKLAEGLWTLQTRKESADEIAEAGRKLFEKLTGFAETFVGVGNAIAQSQRAFEQAHRQLATGRGNAISLAQKMVELGVSPAQGKTMPAQLLESGGVDDTP